MRRDELMPHDGDDDVLVPFDGDVAAEPALAALDAELGRAGGRARAGAARGGADRPSPAFVRDLRSRLLAEAAAPMAAGPWVSPGPSGAIERNQTAAHAPVALRGRLQRRTPTVLPRPAISILAVAAALVVAVLGLDSFWPSPTAPNPAGVTDAVGASLVRDGTTTGLLPGTALRAGDAVTVAREGYASLRFGQSLTRLAGGAAVRIESLDGGVSLDQTAGRAWHRVVVPAGERYVVATGDATWTALGTAFDLARGSDADGEFARLVAIQHDVRVTGRELAATVTEGRVATVRLGDSRDVVVGRATADDLADGWLLANARLDRRAGFELGVLSAVVLDPTPLPSAEPTDEPTIEPTDPTATPASTAEATPASTPQATPKPTPAPTPKPTPRPTPRPTPTPAPTPPPLPSLSLAVTGCSGGFAVLDWSGFGGDAFDHYQGLRDHDSTIPVAYPPQSGAVAPDGLYVTDVGDTWRRDGGLEAGTYYYRMVAFDAGDDPIAKSAVKSVQVTGTKALGELGVGGTAASLEFGWAAFGGPEVCFDYYKLVYSADDTTPSYLEGSPTLAVVENQAAGGWTGAFPGEPAQYHFRLQAIAATPSGKTVVAQTDVATFELTAGG